MLDEQTKKRIEQEAEKQAQIMWDNFADPLTENAPEDYGKHCRLVMAFTIKGIIEKEAERSRGLVEVIEDVLQIKNLTYKGGIRAQQVEQLREALSQYNNPV